MNRSSVFVSVPGLTEDEIFGNAMLFLLAGYDTVSTVMSFTLFCLAANPHCCQRAQEEVDTVVGKVCVWGGGGGERVRACVRACVRARVCVCAI